MLRIMKGYLDMVKRFFCTILIAFALSALHVSGKPLVRRREAIVLTSPPDPYYPPRAILLRRRF